MNEITSPEGLLSFLEDTMSAIFEHGDTSHCQMSIGQRMSEDRVVLLEACHDSKKLSVVMETGTYRKSDGELAILRRSFGLSMYSNQLKRTVLNFSDTSVHALNRGVLQDKLGMMLWIIEDQVGPCDVCGAMTVPMHNFVGNRVGSQCAFLRCPSCEYVKKITPYKTTCTYLNDYLKKKR